MSAPCLLGQEDFVKEPDRRVRGRFCFPFVDKLVESYGLVSYCPR